MVHLLQFKKYKLKWMQMNVAENRSQKGWRRANSKSFAEFGARKTNSKRDRHELNMISVVCLHLIRCMHACVFEQQVRSRVYCAARTKHRVKHAEITFVFVNFWFEIAWWFRLMILCRNSCDRPTTSRSHCFSNANAKGRALWNPECNRALLKHTQCNL